MLWTPLSEDPEAVRKFRTVAIRMHYLSIRLQTPIAMIIPSRYIGIVSGFMVVAPPSTTMFEPVMYEENPLARNPATRATSEGNPALSNPTISCWTFFDCKLEGGN